MHATSVQESKVKLARREAYAKRYPYAERYPLGLGSPLGRSFAEETDPSGRAAQASKVSFYLIT